MCRIEHGRRRARRGGGEHLGQVEEDGTGRGVVRRAELLLRVRTVTVSIFTPAFNRFLFKGAPDSPGKTRRTWSRSARLGRVGVHSRYRVRERPRANGLGSVEGVELDHPV